MPAYVLGVLSKDHHVDFFWTPDGRRHAFEPPYRSQANVQVQDLPQGDVQRPDPAADWRGQGPLDADQVLPEGVDGFVRQPVVHPIVGPLPSQHFLPHNLPLAAVGSGDCGVEHADTGPPDVRTRPIAFDERDDGLVRYPELAVLDRDRGAVCGVSHDVWSLSRPRGSCPLLAQQPRTVQLATDSGNLYRAAGPLPASPPDAPAPRSRSVLVSTGEPRRRIHQITSPNIRATAARDAPKRPRAR